LRIRSIVITGLFIISTFVMVEITSAQMHQGGGRGKGGGKEKPSGNRPSSENSSRSSTGFITRHQYVLRNGIDSQYRNKINPLTADNENLRAGATLFSKQCATCHDSEKSKDRYDIEYMETPPPELSKRLRLPVAMDAYLYWSISMGGVRFNTAMPRFESILGKISSDQLLTEKEIWLVVLYIRQLQSASGKSIEPQRHLMKDNSDQNRQRRPPPGHQRNNGDEMDDPDQPAMLP